MIDSNNDVKKKEHKTNLENSKSDGIDNKKKYLFTYKKKIKLNKTDEKKKYNTIFQKRVVTFDKNMNFLLV